MVLHRTLSVVIPVHNEAGNIGPLIDEVVSALGYQSAVEIVIVNDASSDGTAQEVMGRQTQYPGVRLLEHQTQSGQSAALLTGVLAARHDWIATLDGDGQNDPADIPRCIQHMAVREAQDPSCVMICGHRKKRQDTQLRRMSSKVANAVRRWVLRDNTPDSGCGLKVFRRDVALRLPAFRHMHRFLPALVLSQGYAIDSVDVNHRERGTGKSHYGVHNRLWTGLIDLAGVAWLTRRSIRTRIREHIGGVDAKGLAEEARLNGETVSVLAQDNRRGNTVTTRRVQSTDPSDTIVSTNSRDHNDAGGQHPTRQ